MQKQSRHATRLGNQREGGASWRNRLFPMLQDGRRLGGRQVQRSAGRHSRIKKAHGRHETRATAILDLNAVHERVHLVNGHKGCSTGISHQDISEEGRAVLDEEGSYIENTSTGRKVPMPVDTGVCVVVVNLKDLMNERRPGFCWTGHRT